MASLNVWPSLNLSPQLRGCARHRGRSGPGVSNVNGGTVRGLERGCKWKKSRGEQASFSSAPDGWLLGNAHRYEADVCVKSLRQLVFAVLTIAKHSDIGDADLRMPCKEIKQCSAKRV